MPDPGLRGPVAVLTAMPEEAGAVRSRLRGRTPVKGPHGLCGWSGRMAGVPVTVLLTGEGEKNARRGGLAVLSLRPPPRLLVVMGLGGALDTRLRPLDLVVAARIVREGRMTLAADQVLVAAAQKATGAVEGWVATEDRIADAASRKAELGRVRRPAESESDPGPGVVELESGWYVEPAHEAGLPWIVLRAVSDGVDEDLPSFLEECRDQTGAIQRGKVALHAVTRRPGSLPQLLRLGRRSRGCARVLADALERLVADGVLAVAGRVTEKRS